MPSSYSNDPNKKCKEIDVDTCYVDVAAYRAAMKSILDEYQSLIDPVEGTWVNPAFNYCLGLNDCSGFLNDIALKARMKGRRKCDSRK